VCENQPPVAICQDVDVAADDVCQADASVDDGSFDPDGDDIAVAQDPEGPFPLGETPDVLLTVTDIPGGLEDSCLATVTVVDETAPMVACVESVNPSGKNVPKARKNNEDGFYLVSAADNCSIDAAPVITLGTHVLAEGETIKITQSPGQVGVTLVNTMGPLQIKHFRVGPDDAVITATDGAGNSSSVTCLVPPPPK